MCWLTEGSGNNTMTKWCTSEIYKFTEFGKRILLDVRRCEAYIIEEIDEQILDICSEPKEIKEIEKELSQQYPVDPVLDVIDKWRTNGVLIPSTNRIKGSPFQRFTREYNLTLNMTHSCNLRCRYCYVVNKEQLSTPSVLMSEDIAKRAVEFMMQQFPNMSRLHIGFFGGEPLLNFPVMKTVMAYASKLVIRKGMPEIEYHVSTNATLFTDDMIEFFKKYSITFLVSLDGDQETHDRMRVFLDGRRTHQVVITNLKKLISNFGKNRVGVSAVITHDGSMKSVYDYFCNLNIRYTKFGYVRYTQPSYFTFTQIDKKKYIEDLRDIAKDSLEKLLCGVKPVYSDCELKILHLWKHTRRQYFCPAGIRRFAVAPNGDIYPCGPAAGLNQFKIGNVYTGLDSEQLRDFETYHGINKKAECRKCWARYLCAGGCLLDFVRLYDEDCRISMIGTRLAVAIYAIVKEKNQLLFTSLVNQDYLGTLIKILVDNGFGDIGVAKGSGTVEAVE